MFMQVLSGHLIAFAAYVSAFAPLIVPDGISLTAYSANGYLRDKSFGRSRAPIFVLFLGSNIIGRFAEPTEVGSVA